jgi:DNA-binding NarL/FixJ family response regulator
MLLGAAAVRLGEPDRGLRLLAQARDRAANAHPTIRSEIALNYALAYYGLRKLDAASEELALVTPDSDIIYARALEYQGWIATAQNNHKAAATAFLAAVTHLDQCRYHDRYLEANALRALSHLAYEMLDPNLTIFVTSRVARLDWAAQGLAEPRFWISLNESFTLEMEGRIDEAIQATSRAEHLAQAPPIASHGLVIEAMCRKANILAHEGEQYALRDLAQTISTEFFGLSHAHLADDEINVALAVAEALSQAGDALNASRALTVYHANHQISPMRSLAHDARSLAYRRFIEAQVADAAHDYATANHAYRDAFSRFHALGFRYRALQVAIRLAELTGQEYLYGYASKITKTLPRATWLRRRLELRPLPMLDDTGHQLTDNQIAVLRLVCEGFSNPEIAVARGRSAHTIRNVLARELFPRFGVKTRAALVSEAIRRGIYTGRRATDHATAN